MRRFSICLLALAGSLLGSCDKEVIKPETDTGIISLSSDSEEVTFTNQNRVADISSYPTGGMYEITVTTSYDWELDGIEEISDWCHVEKTGTGLLIDIDKYEEDGTRDGMISLVAEESDIAYVRISQTGLGKEPCIFFGNDKLEYYDNGGEKQIKVVTNMDSWKVSSIEYENGDGWIEAVKDQSGRFFTLSVQKNDSNSGRNAMIALKGISKNGSSITDTIHISQWEATMLFEVEITGEDDMTIRLPFKGEVDLTVVWDDTTQEYFNYARNIASSSDYIAYTYPKAGKYNVRIKGTAEAMSTESYEDDQWPAFINSKYTNQLKALKQWGNLKIQKLRSALAFTGIESIVTPSEEIFKGIESVKWMFRSSQIKEIPADFFFGMTDLLTAEGLLWECPNIKSINEESFSKCGKLENASYLLASCPGISEIPENLFSKNQNLENISFAFAGTGITSVPSEIIASNTAMKNCSGLFSGCTKLNNVPSDLFSKNAEMENLSYLFNQCSSLKEIPSEIFGGLEKVNDLSYVFAECSSIESIPESIFHDNINTQNLENAFFKCINLKNIPTNIFKNLTHTITFKGAFTGCTKIVEIPSGLFTNCSSAENFSYTFSECTSLSTIPSSLFPLSSKDICSCFMKCSAITSVPEGLFDGLAEVEYLNYIFQHCTSLTTLPEGMFEDCAKCETYAYAFYGCTSLTELPERLLNGTNAIMAYNAFKNTFSKCTSLKTIPADLFATCTKTQGITDTFIGCTSLTEIPEGLFDSCTECTDFQGLFTDCSNLRIIPVNIFDNCKKVTNFGSTFSNCSALEVESPYTLVNGEKIHLYERDNENGFTKPWGNYKTFYNASFTDYDNIPDTWKK